MLLFSLKHKKEKKVVFDLFDRSDCTLGFKLLWIAVNNCFSHFPVRPVLELFFPNVVLLMLLYPHCHNVLFGLLYFNIV